MDVNTVSRDGVLGVDVKSRLSEQIQAEKEALSTYTPITPDTKVNTPLGRGDVRSTPALARVFSGQGWTNDRLRTLQGAFCIPEANRGNIGPITIANVNMAVTRSELEPRLTNLV